LCASRVDSPRRVRPDSLGLSCVTMCACRWRRRWAHFEDNSNDLEILKYHQPEHHMRAQLHTKRIPKYPILVVATTVRSTGRKHKQSKRGRIFQRGRPRAWGRWAARKSRGRLFPFRSLKSALSVYLVSPRSWSKGHVSRAATMHVFGQLEPVLDHETLPRYRSHSVTSMISSENAVHTGRRRPRGKPTTLPNGS